MIVALPELFSYLSLLCNSGALYEIGAPCENVQSGNMEGLCFMIVAFLGYLH